MIIKNIKFISCYKTMIPTSFKINRTVVATNVVILKQSSREIMKQLCNFNFC
jgi:hypothetical protein